MREISNKKQTLLRKLNRKKYRVKEQLFMIEGARAVRQVLENDILNPHSLYFDASQSLVEEPYWEKMGSELTSYLVPGNDFLDISDTEHPQGVLAIFEIPAEQPVEEMASQNNIIVATDAIQDPGNLGTIIRTATWFGATGLLAGKGTVDVFHPKVVRSTAGATGAVSWRNAVLPQDLHVFEQAGWQTVLLDGSAGAEPVEELTAIEKIILVVGNEANGVDKKLFAENRITAKISCPVQQRSVESLNAAVAASIALYALSSLFD